MNKKLLGILGIGCGLLLLTGCGGSSNTLTCSKEADGQNMTTSISFDKDGKPESATLEIVMDGSEEEGVTKENIGDYAEMVEAYFCSEDYDSCKVTTSGLTITLKATAKPSALDLEEEATKEDLKKEAEEDGFTCK